MNIRLNHNETRALIGVVLVSICCVSLSTHAGQDRDTNASDGLNVTMGLNHQVVIPQILFFRIGASGSGIEQVNFDLTSAQALRSNNSDYDGSSLALGDGAVIDASSNGALDVYLISNIAPVDISYTISDPNGLADGAGNFIAYDQIITDTSDAGLPAPILDNAGGAVGSANAVTVNGNSFGGRVANYNATWTYRYRNQQHPIAGLYAGRVTYTASVP